MNASEYRTAKFNEDEALLQLLRQGWTFTQAAAAVGPSIRYFTGAQLNRMIDRGPK